MKPSGFVQVDSGGVLAVGLCGLIKCIISMYVSINICKYLKGECEEDGARPFLVVPRNRTRQWTETDALERPPEHEEELQCAVTKHWN